MKWELDDNARSGFHYLGLGVVVVAALVLVNWGVDRLVPPFGPHGAFGHGYLVRDNGDGLLIASTTRAERLATSVLLAFCAGAGVLLLGRLAVRGAAKRWLLPLGRAVFIAVLSYFAYAAVKLPRAEFIGFRDDMFILWERDVAFCDLPWPGSKRIKLVPFTEVARPTVTVQYIGDNRLAYWMHLELRNGQVLQLGNSSPVPPEDMAVPDFANARAKILSSMMHAHVR